MKQHLPVDALKQRAIDEFTYIIRETSKGYKPKLSSIMNILVFLELQTELENYTVIYQKLNNNGL